MLMQLPMGLLLDRFGPKKVIASSLFMCVTGTFLLAYSGHYYLACGSRFLTGLGTAAAVIGCLKLVSIWFDKRHFASLTGLMMTVGMLGAVSGDALVQYMLSFYHWQHLLLLCACFGAVLFVLITVFVRDHEDLLKGPDDHERGAHFSDALKTVLSKKQSWYLSLYSGLMFAPVSAFSGSWGVMFLHQAYNFSSFQSAQVMSSIFYGFAIGAPLWGWWSDRIQKRKVFMVYGTLAALLTASLAIYGQGMPLSFYAVSLFLFGLFISSFVISFTMIREIHPIVFSATAMGFMNAFNSISSAQIVTWIGYMLDKQWKGGMLQGHRIYTLHAYHQAMFLAPLALILALLLLFFIRDTGAPIESVT